MKTLILYATKHGAAQEIARRVAGRMDGAETHDLKRGGIPSLDGFDRVIVGSSLYAGQIRKEAKAFLSQNAEALRQKELGLFLSGLDMDQEKKFLEANIPPDILRSAKAASLLGGIFDPEKAGFLERFIMKVITKRSEYSDVIDDGKIERFAAEMGECR